jgi:biotin-(acetyl-CoA carboxylase) ligase
METEARGFGAIRPLYDGYLALKGRVVTVIDGASRTTGKVRGIDQDGALVLEANGGAVRIVAGDVTVEGAYI